MKWNFGIGFSPLMQKSSGSWSSYWLTQNINLHTSGRNGLALSDSLGNDIPILPAYLHKSAGTEYAYIQDNGVLDIGATDFTIFGRLSILTKNTYHGLLGKLAGGGVYGRYGFFSNTTTGLVIFQFNPNSGNNIEINTGIDGTTGEHFYLAEIDQANHLVRVYVDNVQIGDAVSYTGAVASMDNAYRLYLGAWNTTPTGAPIYISKSTHSDCGLLNRLLSAEEKANLLLGIFPDDCKAYWPIMGAGDFIPDASGNDYHLTGINLNNIVNTRFSLTGSKHGLNKGFALYQNGWDEIYVGNKVDGTEIIPTNIPAGYKKTAEGVHSGNNLKHNLANSVLAMIGTSWDRSDTTIFSEEARRADTYYDATSAATKKYWHVSECNNLKFQSWANAGYKGISAFKISDHSYKLRKTLDEILSFDAELTGANYSKLINYCKDYVYSGEYENDVIYWKYVTDSILATRGAKRLKWENAATNKFHLSIDGGVTYPYSINSPFNSQTPTFAHIFENGNILIGGTSSLYLSTNNLSTFILITTKDINGTDYTPGANDFHEYFKTKNILKGGVEMLIWGCYRTFVGSDDTNINIWYSVDNGVTVKSCYKAGVTNPPNLKARHIHSVTYREADDSFWVTTGDNNAAVIQECNILRGVYDWDADIWSWSKIYGDTSGERDWKWTQIGFFEESVFFASDNTNNKTLGLATCAIADIGNPANFVSKFRAINEGGDFVMDNSIIVGFQNMLVATKDKNNVIISKTGVDGLTGNKLYGLPASIVNFAAIYDKDISGYYLMHLTLEGDSSYDKYGRGSLLVKLK